MSLEPDTFRASMALQAAIDEITDGDVIAAVSRINKALVYLHADSSPTGVIPRAPRHPNINILLGLVHDNPFALVAEVERVMRNRDMDEAEILTFRKEVYESAAPVTRAVIENWVTVS